MTFVDPAQHAAAARLREVLALCERGSAIWCSLSLPARQRPGDGRRPPQLLPQIEAFCARSATTAAEP